MIFIFRINFRLELKNYLFINHTYSCFIFKTIFQNLYQQLINKNIIQKILLVGSYKDIKILERFEKF